MGGFLFGGVRGICLHFVVGKINVPTSLNVYKKIIYTYTDENKIQQTCKSVLSYTSNQVQHLQNKGTFKIKCKGNLSAIIEELPAQNKNFNIYLLIKKFFVPFDKLKNFSCITNISF